MATRKPPAVEEIVESLKKAPGIKQDRAMLYGYAVGHLRQEFHTTAKKAAEWLVAATGVEPHEFELVGTRGGRVFHLARAAETLMLNEAGYSSTSDENYWPQLSFEGIPVTKDPDRHNREYVVLSKDLQSMCDRAYEFRTSAMAVQQTKETAAVAGAEARHGSSIALFRGLLKMAGVEATSDVFSARYTDLSLRGGYTALHLDLFDDKIDAVAKVLSAFGIEPDPSNAPVTKLPD